MRLLPQVMLLALLLPLPLAAQRRPLPIDTLPIDTARTEPDQELDGFGGRYRGLHVLSVRLRGVRAAHGVVYWVSATGRQLSAYQAGRRLWTTNVAAPFLAEIPAARIRALVLASDILFVSLGPRGMAEIDRITGRISARYFDRDPHNLVAAPS